VERIRSTSASGVTADASYEIVALPIIRFTEAFTTPGVLFNVR
jgi:hypothetical protein